MAELRKNRYLVLRRISQVGIMLLFIAGNLLGWKVLTGNLSSSRVMNLVPLTDPFAVLQVFASRHLVSAEALAGAALVLLFFGVLAGRAFCSWVCPLNLVTDLAGWLRKKTGLEQDGGQPGISRNARYWAIGVSFLVSLVTGIAAFEWISPISMLHRGLIFGMGMGWALVLAVFLFDLLLVKQGFCGHLCPLGGFYSLATRFSLVRVNHCKEKCTLCMKCLEICPERQVLPMVGSLSSSVSSGECTNCGRCIEVCMSDAMKFGIRSYSRDQDPKIA
ncbi:MAG: quinol dehydrogenase ferredoxin subunit NapH [Thermodesulfovibrio sp.]|nr:quinol dehydrogenase ferredoxin subunit NapH [Thermodesulfovibrio sp.]